MSICWIISHEPGLEFDERTPVRDRLGIAYCSCEVIPCRGANSGFAVKGSTMHWVYLYVAIAFEVVGTTALKASDGMARLGIFFTSLAFYAMSILLLAHALKTLPVSVSYAIWAGMGTLLVILVGIVWFKEPLTPLRLLFMAFIVIGAVGLNLTVESSS